MVTPTSGGSPLSNYLSQSPKVKWTLITLLALGVIAGAVAGASELANLKELAGSRFLSKDATYILAGACGGTLVIAGGLGIYHLATRKPENKDEDDDAEAGTTSSPAKTLVVGDNVGNAESDKEEEKVRSARPPPPPYTAKAKEKKVATKSATTQTEKEEVADKGVLATVSMSRHPMMSAFTSFTNAAASRWDGFLRSNILHLNMPKPNAGNVAKQKATPLALPPPRQKTRSKTKKEAETVMVVAQPNAASYLLERASSVLLGLGATLATGVVMGSETAGIASDSAAFGQGDTDGGPGDNASLLAIGSAASLTIGAGLKGLSRWMQ